MTFLKLWLLKKKNEFSAKPRDNNYIKLIRGGRNDK
jgi:hypothetical protein